MCGRYRLSRRKQLIQEYFDTVDEVDWEPRYNIAPSQSVGIIRQDRAKPERRFSLARWGLIPTQATDPGVFRDHRRSRLGASLQHRSIAERWDHSPGPGEARTSFLAGQLG